MALKFGFVLLPHFTLTAFFTFVDALRLAGDEGDRSRPVDCYTAVSFPATMLFRACAKRMVLVPR